MNYGVMIAIVQSTVRKFEKMKAADGTALLNEFDCPLLTLTSDMCCISPLLICRSVSIVHECGTSCCFLNSKFIHYYTNCSFCFNFFCTGNYFLC